MSDVVPLHRNRDFRRLWVGEALSDLGANASALAFPLLVLAVTGSPFQAGLVGAASLAAGAVLSLPAGAIVDRFDRKRLMIYCDLSRFIALGGLGLAVVADRASLALILTAVVVEAAASTLFGPAHSAALRHIVPRSQLGTAAARNESRSYATSLAGGPIGGALFAVSRAAPFLADALTYLASLVAIARIRKPLEEERSSEEREKFFVAIRRGLSFVLKEPFLRAVLAITPLLNMASTGMFFVLVVVLQQRGMPAAGIGAFQSVVLVGGLAGSLIAPWLQSRASAATLIIALSWLGAGFFATMVFIPGTYLLAVPLILAMLISPAVNASMFAYRVAITPDSMQGRVQSTNGLLAMALSPLGPLFGGLLIELGDGRIAFAGLAGLLGLAALIATFSTGIRTMRPLDDETPHEHSA